MKNGTVKNGEKGFTNLAESPSGKKNGKDPGVIELSGLNDGKYLAVD